jgi:hypothetical protein
VSLREEKQQWTMDGEVSGPVGVSLAAWYSGRANKAKLGIKCLKNPMKPKKDKISWLSLGGERSFKVWTQSMVSAFEVGVRQKPRKVTASKQSWALAGETQYLLEARKLRRLAVPFSESCWEGEHRRRSLTYCRSVLGFVLHMTRSRARV